MSTKQLQNPHIVSDIEIVHVPVFEHGLILASAHNLQDFFHAKLLKYTVGMGVVTISISASRASLGLSRRSTAQQSSSNGPLILGFKVDKNKKTALVAVSEPRRLHAETKKENTKRLRSVTKPVKRLRATTTSIAEASPYAAEIDLNEAAAKLESIFKLSPATDVLDAEIIDHVVKERRGRRRKSTEVDEEREKEGDSSVVRNRNRKAKRLSLAKRIELKNSKESKEEKAVPLAQKKKVIKNEDEKIDELVREYSASTDLSSLDWKKMKIPPVLPSSEHTWLFKLMEPMKVVKPYLNFGVFLHRFAFSPNTTPCMVMNDNEKFMKKKEIILSKLTLPLELILIFLTNLLLLAPFITGYQTCRKSSFRQNIFLKKALF